MSWSDPIGDIQRFAKKMMEEPTRFPHNCEIDGHITQFASLYCPICYTKTRDKISEDEEFILDRLFKEEYD